MLYNRCLPTLAHESAAQQPQNGLTCVIFQCLTIKVLSSRPTRSCFGLRARHSQVHQREPRRRRRHRTRRRGRESDVRRRAGNLSPARQQQLWEGRRRRRGPRRAARVQHELWEADLKHSDETKMISVRILTYAKSKHLVRAQTVRIFTKRPAILDQFRRFLELPRCQNKSFAISYASVKGRCFAQF